MLKNDVIKRLDELQGYEKLEFVLGQHKKKQIQQLCRIVLLNRLNHILFHKFRSQM